MNNMKVIDTEIADVKIIEPAVFNDERGWFTESWQQQKFSQLVADVSFVQDNHSVSAKGVLRGLHYQVAPYEQGKLVRVVKGRAFDVAVDIRPASPTYGKHVAIELSESNKKMLWVPPGFAHGFIALEDDTHFLYKTTNFYNKSCERSLKWSSPLLDINWPLLPTLNINEKDDMAPDFKFEKPAGNESATDSIIKQVEFKCLGDDRGSLVSLESMKNIPFDVKRIYYIFNTKDGVARGFHAHRSLKQVALAVKGSCRFVIDDGTVRESVVLNSPTQGILIDSCVWREMHDFSHDCVLMVLASEYYDENDYLRDYDSFIEAVKP